MMDDPFPDVPMPEEPPPRTTAAGLKDLAIVATLVLAGGGLYFVDLRLAAIGRTAWRGVAVGRWLSGTAVAAFAAGVGLGIVDAHWRTSPSFAARAAARAGFVAFNVMVAGVVALAILGLVTLPYTLRRLP